VIGGQPHMLAYINPEEEQMLYAAGGSGEPGPGGVPSFAPSNPGDRSTAGTASYDRFQNMVQQQNRGYSDNNSPAELAYVAARQAAARRAAANAAAEAAAAQQAVVDKAAAQQAAATAAANKQAANSFQGTGITGLGGQGVGVGGGSALPDNSVTASSEPITLAQLDAARAAQSNNQVDSQSGTQLADIVRRQAAAQRNAAANKQAANSFQGTGIAGLSGQGVPTAAPVAETVPTVPLATVTNKEPNAAEKLAGYRKNTPNTFREFLANALTPGDQMKYVNGQLVYGDNHPNAGQPVPEDATNSFGLKVGMGNSVGNDNPGAGNFANSGEARAANQGGLPGIGGAIAGTLGQGMAFLGGIRPEDVAVGRGADGLQIFETGVRNSTGETGYFYVIDPMTGLVRNVKGANDSTSPLVDMSQMMDDASSNNSAEELAYVANLQAEQDAINNPVVDDPYSPTPLTRAGTGMGSNVGTIYDTGNTIVESGTNPFAQGNQVGALTFEELMRLNQQQNRIL
jgi:hypothetical protein